VTAEAIEGAIGPINRSLFEVAPEHGAPSPGLQRRHYAPSTHLEAIEHDGREHVVHLLGQQLRVGWLSLRPAAVTDARLTFVEMPADPAGYAARLYEVLHELDRAGLDRIVVDLPPDSNDWLAVRDRLKRAAAPPT
jgi:L-threonylcarbamoyladenylate synthase